MRTAAPSARGLAQSLAQATGLAPSQVSERNVCPRPAAGRASCAAQVLVLRSGGGLVRPHVHRHPSLGRVAAASRPGIAVPAGGASSPPQTGTPAFLQEAYDLSYLSQTGGSGDTVAVVDAYDDPTAEQDLAAYRSYWSLPACTTANGCFKKVNQNGQASNLPAWNPDWEQEEALDLDTVSAVCPNCHILLVEANSSYASDLQTAMATAASMGAKQISDSWTASAAEPSDLGSGPFTFSGIATVAATGDAGYVGTGQDNYPAAFPGVTAAGGTSLAAAGAPTARGFGEQAWSLDASGYGGGSGCDVAVAKPGYQTDTGCTGRSYADLSADADPSTGLFVYDSGSGGWLMVGGTSLSTPLIASYYAITGVTKAGSPKWAYNDSALLNDVVSGSNGTCANDILYICNAGVGYDGPTGVGSISGAVVTGAPGIGGPPIASGSASTYTESVASDGAAISGGIYPNGLDTSWWIEYGTTTAYGSQTPASDIGSGTSPVSVNGYLLHLTPGGTYHYRLVAKNSRGTTYGYDYTFTTPAVSSNSPRASFTTDPSVPQPGVVAKFDGSLSTDSGATITDYRWDFGDGTTEDTGTNPTANHAYNARGVYQTTLIVTNNQGQHDIITQNVTADDQPSVALTAPAAATPGSVLNFSGTASAGAGGALTGYSWNFGDGSADEQTATPTDSHTYTTAGTYTVTLTATDDLGVSAVATETVTVDAPPTAAFDAPDPAIPGSPATFDASTSSDAFGKITGYSWTFPGGTTATGTDASYTFPASGQYQVTLSVTNDAGQTDTITRTVAVEQPPTASLSPSATPTTPGSQVSFSGAASADPITTIVDYSWSFGDGATDDTGTTPSDSHTYADPGVYTVTLTATDGFGVTATATTTITVDAAPTAAFTSPPGPQVPGSAVSFDAGGSTDAVGTITTYSWDFGDGETASGPNPSHEFARGRHDVTLTVTNDAGQSSTASQTVTVDDPPTVAFTPSSDVAASGATVSFVGAGSSPDPGGAITGYHWNFGDGADDDTATPVDNHAYTTPGTYTITLTATDDLGVTVTATHTVTVDAQPTARFTASSSSSTPGSNVSFDAGGSTDAVGTITSYRWTFGDGSTGNGPNPTHAFAASGTYTVVLTVTNDAGQTATASKTITVENPPVPAPTPAPTPAPLPAPTPAPTPVAPHESAPPAGTPITPAPPSLNGRVTGTRNQTLASVTKHGLRLTLSVTLTGRASFQVTIPPGPRKASSRGRPATKPAPITLLRIRARAVAPGSHRVTLRLSRAAIGQLRARGRVLVTVRVRVVDAYGTVITRSLNITIHR